MFTLVALLSMVLVQTGEESAWHGIDRRYELRKFQVDTRALEAMGRIHLVVLGNDEASGLSEFALLGTGRVPRKAELAGVGAPKKDWAVVLVLVPGGEQRLGWQRDARDAIWNLGKTGDDAPAGSFRARPFLISKWELTSGQWNRMTQGRKKPHVVRPDDHPVAGLEGDAVLKTLKRFQMRLPYETEWEYAARGGGAGFFGSFVDVRACFGNLADLTAYEKGKRWIWVTEWAPWRDGFIEVAPVGRFQSNSWGLYDVIGNAPEVCLIGSAGQLNERYVAAAKASLGRAAAVMDDLWVLRGSGYKDGLLQARLSRRRFVSKKVVVEGTIRPVLPLPIIKRRTSKECAAQEGGKKRQILVVFSSP